jgi:hypothetical protein
LKNDRNSFKISFYQTSKKGNHPSMRKASAMYSRPRAHAALILLSLSVLLQGAGDRDPAKDLSGCTPEERRLARYQIQPIKRAKTTQVDSRPKGENDTCEFDLETELNSKTISLAWGIWHKQLATAIFERANPTDSGWVSFRIRVDLKRRITFAMLKSSGSQQIDKDVEAAVKSLNGDPGLAYPVGSTRKLVTDDLVFTSGSAVKEPGVTWRKNDFENVHI